MIRSGISIAAMTVRVPGWAVLAYTHDGAELIAWFLDQDDASAWASELAGSLGCPLVSRLPEA